MASASPPLPAPAPFTPQQTQEGFQDHLAVSWHLAPPARTEVTGNSGTRSAEPILDQEINLVQEADEHVEISGIVATKVAYYNSLKR